MQPDGGVGDLHAESHPPGWPPARAAGTRPATRYAALSRCRLKPIAVELSFHFAQEIELDLQIALGQLRPVGEFLVRVSDVQYGQQRS